MKRKTKWIAGINIGLIADNTSEQDEEIAFEKFSKLAKYDPTKEYIVVYNDDRDIYYIYELL